MNKNRYLAIAGNMGVGKSSLVQFIKNEFGATAFFEPDAANPYLADFFADMKLWAYHSQIFYLGQKFQIHQKIQQQSGLVVLDRTIFEDGEIFAQGLYEDGRINERDYQCYMTLYHCAIQSLDAPDVLIYLRCSLASLKDRVVKRGMSYEKGVSDDYLIELQNRYDKWIANYNRGRVVVIETDQLDYLSDSASRAKMLVMLNDILKN